MYPIIVSFALIPGYAWYVIKASETPHQQGLGHKAVHSPDPSGHMESDDSEQCSEYHEEREHPDLDPESAPRTGPDHRMAEEDLHDRGCDKAHGEAEQHDRNREIDHPEWQHEYHIEQGRPGAVIAEPHFDPIEPRSFIPERAGSSRHPDAEQGFDEPSFHQGDGAGRGKEEQKDRYPDNKDQQTDGEAQTGDRPGEIENAGRQTQQHVEEGGVRSRLRDDAEEGDALQWFGWVC